jgi:hypothetical protein
VSISNKGGKGAPYLRGFGDGANERERHDRATWRPDLELSVLQAAVAICVWETTQAVHAGGVPDPYEWCQ